jgi:hypothetical protein
LTAIPASGGADLPRAWQRRLMSLDGLGYEDRNVGLAALVEGADEDGGEDNPEVIAIARTDHLEFAVRVGGGR